jgi:homoserine O-succinyltransferase
MPVFQCSRTSREPRSRKGADDPIVIGLVNNMSDAALQTTERQFRELLSAASGNVEVQLKLFSLPEVPRGDAGRSRVSQSYEDVSELWTGRLDGLIVTGAEPRAPELAEEPYWPALTKLADWAEAHTRSTIWSCLAAHAAVLHIDGIGRRALGEKLSGTFDCIKAEDHTIVVGTPPRWHVPHSRYNELPEKLLVLKGYRVLSRSSDAGVDIFVKHRNSLFIFFQGHPEYDSGALFREYRRDSGRFLTGEREYYPDMPRGYFDEHSRGALAAFRDQVLKNPGLDLISSFPAVAEENVVHSWRGMAVQIYANWLSYLVEQRSRDSFPTKSHIHHSRVSGPPRILQAEASRCDDKPPAEMCSSDGWLGRA